MNARFMRRTLSRSGSFESLIEEAARHLWIPEVDPAKTQRRNREQDVVDMSHDPVSVVDRVVDWHDRVEDSVHAPMRKRKRKPIAKSIGVLKVMLPPRSCRAS